MFECTWAVALGPHSRSSHSPRKEPSAVHNPQLRCSQSKGGPRDCLQQPRDPEPQLRTTEVTTFYGTKCQDRSRLFASFLLQRRRPLPVRTCGVALSRVGTPGHVARSP